MTEQEKRLIRIATACMLLLVLISIAVVVFLSVEIKKRGHVDITYQTITNDNFDPKKLTDDQRQVLIEKLNLTPKDGKDGRDGRDGQTGQQGTPGTNGVNGKDGYTPVKGVDYFDGERGVPGETGAPGPVGKTVFIRENPETKKQECKYSGDLGWSPIEECQ